MPITRKRRAETIADNSPDRSVKRQSARVKNNNVKYTDNEEYNESYSSRKNKEKTNFDPKNTTEKTRICSNCQKFGHFEDVCTNPFPFCCAFCGGEKHEKSHCPARDETCSKCLKSGHFGNVCLSAGSGKKQLLLQNEVRQRDYKDYEVNLGSKNTAIKNLKVRLETSEKYLKEEVNLTNSLKETNADLKAKLDKIMHENKVEIGSNSDKIQELVEMNIGVKTTVGKMKDSNFDCLIVEIKLDEIRQNFQDAMEVISRRNGKIKDLEESDIAAKNELAKTKQELESKNNDVKSFETQLASLKKDLNADARIKLDLLEVIGKEGAKFEDLETLHSKLKSEFEKTKQDHLRELESKNKDIEFLENQLKTHKNTLKESNADSKAQLKRVLKRYQAETIENSNKIKEFENLNIQSQAKWDKEKQDHLSEVESKNNFIKHLEIQVETLKKDLKVA